MEKLLVVAVKDRAAELFNRPFYCPTEAIAIRQFANEVNRDASDNPLFTNPTDFELYVVGRWDDTDGSLSSEQGVTGSRPRLIARGEEVRRPIVK